MVKRRGGLGRGLGTFIPTETVAAVSGQDVDIDAVGPNPHQPRQHIDDERLAELTESIRIHGILQPLLVTRVAGDEVAYRIIAGERRWRAARAAGLTRVPVVVKETTPGEQLELALVENVQRADLSPLEEAAAYRQLAGEFGLTQEQIAGRVGRSRVAIANTLRLLNAPPELKDALTAGRITEGHVRALLGLKSAAEQVEALALVERQGLTVRQTEELIRRWLAAGLPKRPMPTPRPPDFDRLEDRFRRALGTRVTLQKSRKGGRVVIHFFSDDELDGIYRQIVGEEEE
ncbi:MAG: ParB/RepB/Spo0J family partition protein [Thermomicrobiales bacterium]